MQKPSWGFFLPQVQRKIYNIDDGAASKELSKIYLFICSVSDGCSAEELLTLRSTVPLCASVFAAAAANAGDGHLLLLTSCTRPLTAPAFCHWLGTRPIYFSGRGTFSCVFM